MLKPVQHYICSRKDIIRTSHKICALIDTCAPYISPPTIMMNGTKKKLAILAGEAVHSPKKLRRD